MDGNADTDMRNKHCSHTNKDNPSWWRVDLGLDHAAVYEIRIVNSFTGDPGNNSVDYKITFGEYIRVHLVVIKLNTKIILFGVSSISCTIAVSLVHVVGQNEIQVSLSSNPKYS